MRTKKELGELMLKNFEKLFYCGLCAYIDDLYEIGEINIYEFRLIDELIKATFPDSDVATTYYWDVGKEEPRIKWIKDNLINVKN